VDLGAAAVVVAAGECFGADERANRRGGAHDARDERDADPPRALRVVVMGGWRTR
jgi:hypothetical protein